MLDNMINGYQMVESPTDINGIQVIQDLDETVKALENGQDVMRYECGDSMQPILVSQEYAHLIPLTKHPTISTGDAVFCQVNGCWMTHMVWLISGSPLGDKQYLIGSSSGQLYGWTTKILAYAKGTKVLENIKNLENIDSNE